uniref:Transforming growth factor, alpha n=1 Tax=Astyanax mexicanus TaxID=7994 RepID=A0A8B9LBN6_ASTMX
MKFGHGDFAISLQQLYAYNTLQQWLYLLTFYLLTNIFRVVVLNMDFRVTLLCSSVEFIAAAVHSHFADCPDSHSQFCFHGTCRFLILEETPACVCHPGFMGMRCEHADLLAVVATNHRQQTVATMLVLCVVGSVLLMLLCTLLNCWWRRGGCRQGLSCLSEKPSTIIKGGSSCCHSETVV